MGQPHRRVLLHWIPAFLAVLMIALESTVFMSASNTSRWLLPIWEHLFGPISPERWNVVHGIIRKTGHFIGYGLVSFCFFHGFRNTLTVPLDGSFSTGRSRVPRGLRTLWMRCSTFAIGCTIVIASADELHQAFLPGRGSSPLDVLLDTCGAILAQLIILALMPRLARKSTGSLGESFAR